MIVASASVIIDDSLWFILLGIQSVTGAPMKGSVMKQIFSGCASDQVTAKKYIIAQNNTLKVIGYVEEYEPESLNIVVESTMLTQDRLDLILENSKYIQFLRGNH